MADPRTTEPLPLPPLALLVCGAALTAASHTLWLPYWVDATAAALLIWRALASIRGTALPARWLLVLLTFGGAIGVFFSYRTIMGRDPGVTMLVLLLFLKLLETRARRDVFVVAFLIYFVALANFFYSQSIPIAGLMLLTVLVTTTALVGFSAPQRPVLEDLKTAGRRLARRLRTDPGAAQPQLDVRAGNAHPHPAERAPHLRVPRDLPDADSQPDALRDALLPPVPGAERSQPRRPRAGARAPARRQSPCAGAGERVARVAARQCRDRAPRRRVLPWQPVRVHLAAAAARGGLGGRVPVRRDAGMLRALRLELRISDARRRGACPRGDRLPGRRHESGGRLHGRAPGRRPRMGRSMARRGRLDPRRSHCRRGPGPGRARHHGRRACGTVAAHAHQPQLAEGPAQQLGGPHQPVEPVGARLQPRSPARDARVAGRAPTQLGDDDLDAVLERGRGSVADRAMAAARITARGCGAARVAALLRQARPRGPCAGASGGPARLREPRCPNAPGERGCRARDRRALRRSALRPGPGRSLDRASEAPGSGIQPLKTRTCFFVAAALALQIGSAAAP